MYIKIHITTESKHDELIIKDDTLYEIKVRAPAERGLANNAMLKIIKDKHPDRKIRIVSGHLHPHKIISLD